MADLNSKYLRAYGLVSDGFGVDPLRDKIVPFLAKITTFTNHFVTQDERGAPDLISFREYGTSDLWWYIMAYNGIARWKEIVEGVSLKIPEHASILSIVSYAEIMPENAQGTRLITI